MAAFLPDSLTRMAEHVIAGGEITRAQAETLCEERLDLHDLLFVANKVRLHFKGDRIEFCSIVNAKSGACSEDCTFCSQAARYQTNAPVYGLLPAEKIASAARDAEKNGARCFGFVVSGYGPNAREMEHYQRTLSAIEAESSIRRGASLGILSPQQARELAAAGMEMINHNLETGERFLAKMCTTHSYAERVATLKAVRAAGMKLCSGGIFGMGESWSDRLDLLFTLREIGVDSLPVNFLNPIPGTPLADVPRITPRDALRCIAITRMIHPRADIRVCGGREVNLRDTQSWMFYAGANAAMLGNYLTTCGRPVEEDLRMLDDLGLVHDRPHLAERATENRQVL